MHVRFEMVEPAMAALLRQKSEAERLRIGWACGKWPGSCCAAAPVRACRLVEEQIQLETARRLSGSR